MLPQWCYQFAHCKISNAIVRQPLTAILAVWCLKPLLKCYHTIDFKCARRVACGCSVSAILAAWCLKPLLKCYHTIDFKCARRVACGCSVSVRSGTQKHHDLHDLNAGFLLISKLLCWRGVLYVSAWVVPSAQPVHMAQPTGGTMACASILGRSNGGVFGPILSVVWQAGLCCYRNLPRPTQHSATGRAYTSRSSKAFVCQIYLSVDGK